MEKREREKMLLRNNGRSRSNQKPACLYCYFNEHFSHNWTKVLDTAVRTQGIRSAGHKDAETVKENTTRKPATE